MPGQVGDFLGIVEVHMSTGFRENRLTFEYFTDCFVFSSPQIALYSRPKKKISGALTNRLGVHMEGVLPCKISNLLLVI